MDATTEDILQHFGVKGMKWGVRKKTDSVNVSSAKNELSKRKDLMKKANATMQKQTKNGLLAPNKASLTLVNNASRELRYSKEDLSKVKILEKVGSRPKSKWQQEAEQKYKDRGLSDDEATVAAYKNIRTKKILAGTAVAALTVAGAYAAYKINDDRVDKIIKAGSRLQNITSESDVGVRDAFYSSSNPLDRVKYKGMYGGTLSSRGDVFTKDIKVLSDIKQASPRNAQNMLSDIISKDSGFTVELRDYIASNKDAYGSVYTKKFEKAHKSLSKGIVDKNVYEVFNASLVDHGAQRQKLTDKYFGEMAKKGYNALKDTNDSKYSGYQAINPIITFGAKGKVSVVDVKKLTNSEIKKSGAVAIGSILGKDLAKKGAVTVAGIGLGQMATNKLVSNSNTKRINAYKEQHPNSEMTNTDIIRMLERGGA